MQTREFQTDEFQLANGPAKAPNGPPIHGIAGRQLSMFGGLDCPVGTQNLFDVDGADRLPPEPPEELPDEDDDDGEGLPAVWCTWCDQPGITTVPYKGGHAWACEDCAADPSRREEDDGPPIGSRLVFTAEEFAALFDEPTNRLAWCSTCRAFTEQTADLLPFVCDQCGQEP